MQLPYIYRLTFVLCTFGLIQVVVIDPCLARLGNRATPGMHVQEKPPAGTAPRPAGSAGKEIEVAQASTSNQRGRSADTPEASVTADSRGGSSADSSKGGLLSWLSRPGVQQVLSRVAPSLTMYYARSIADSDSSDFSHSLGFIGSVVYNATPHLTFSTELALYQEFGGEYERFVASNWFFDVTRTFDLAPAGVLHPSIFVKLPTNPDDREYLTYIGTIGVDAELRKHNFYKFHKDHAIGGSVGFITARNIFEKTHNETGYPNTLWQVSAYTSLSYKFRESFMFIFKFKNNWLWYPESDRANDQYLLSALAYYSPIKQLWLSFGTVSEDRTFLYDQVTSNVALHSPKATSLLFSLIYLPRISKTHELSR